MTDPQQRMETQYGDPAKTRDMPSYRDYPVSDAELPSRSQPPGWAVGFIALGGSLLFISGCFQFLQGLAAVIDDQFYVRAPNYTYRIDTTAWGWTHMGIGIVAALAGIGLFTGNPIARVVACVVAIASIISNFFFVPYYPVWSIMIIALDVVVLWAVIAHGGALRNKEPSY